MNTPNTPGHIHSIVTRTSRQDLEIAKNVINKKRRSQHPSGIASLHDSLRILMALLEDVTSR